MDTRLLIRRSAGLICVNARSVAALLLRGRRGTGEGRSEIQCARTFSARIEAATGLLPWEQHDHLAFSIALPTLLLQQPVGDELAHRLPAGVDRQLPDRRVVGADCQL